MALPSQTWRRMCSSLDDAGGACLQVKCQAHGTSTRAVLAELRGLGSKRAGVASLYRGLGASAIVAAMVGAVYLSSFHFFRCRQPPSHL